MTDLSVGFKEGYDDSVFLSSVDPKYLPAVYPVPAGSAVALKNSGSWVTTVSPKIGVNLAPLLGNPQALPTLSLAYAPEIGRYHDQPSENYEAHRFAGSIKAKQGAFSLGLDDSLAYVNGSRMAPTYPGNFITAYNIVAPRERREQIQDRANVLLQYDWEKWFVRPSASFLYYDMMTKQINVKGYQNYEDRYDVNGGPDFGCRIAPQLAMTVGYRYGHQYQQQFSFDLHSTPSDYQRALIGLEGKPWKWLELKIQGGPDFRNYPADTAARLTPIRDRNLITYYGEASLTATLTPKNAVAFKYKQWQWVSSVGKVPYFDGSYDLSYHRKLTDKLGLDLGGRLLTGDYNSGSLATCKRDDAQYTVSAALGYAFNPHASVSLAYALDLGRNDQANVVNPETREYDHQLVSLGVQFKF